MHIRRHACGAGPAHLELQRAPGGAGGGQHVGGAHVLRRKPARLPGQRPQLLRVDGVHILPAQGQGWVGFG